MLTRRQLEDAYERALGRVERGDQSAERILKMYRTRLIRLRGVEQGHQHASLINEGVVNPPSGGPAERSRAAA
jgi:hypothetical protein